MRTDYKIERNKQIYEEYQSTKASLNQLAKKFSVSPQRIRFIINEFKEKELATTLTENASKEDRDKLKNKAIEVRESGKPQIALLMFDEVIRWDMSNNNYRGQADVLGHKKICFSLMADKATSAEKKVELLGEAEDCIVEALEILKKNNEEPGRLAVQKVHLVSLMLDKAASSTDEKSKTAEYEEALKIINEAITNLPGSRAHKAWPALNKSQILYFLGRKEEALTTLTQAQLDLCAGYDDELNSPKDPVEQGILKIKVWSTGVNLGFAKILLAEKKYYLAEIYANAIITTPDPKGTLKVRKTQAKKILATIKDATS